MIHAAIIPDRQIIRILPSMPNLQVVVLRNQLYEPVQRGFAFFFGEPVDLLHVVADCEDGLPTGHRIGADYGVCGG